MTPSDARQILHEDAVLHVTELSVNEWTTRIAEEPQLKEAADLVGARTVDAITRFVWQWDRPGKRKKR